MIMEKLYGLITVPGNFCWEYSENSFGAGNIVITAAAYFSRLSDAVYAVPLPIREEPEEFGFPLSYLALDIA